MRFKFIDVTNGFNWGKMGVGVFTPDEWAQKSAVDGRGLLSGRGWDVNYVFVLDLQTGEGAIFRPGGYHKADLEKHAIWVCPLYEPFLEWLYAQLTQQRVAVDDLPALVELPNAQGALYGHRRPGPTTEERHAWTQRVHGHDSADGAPTASAPPTYAVTAVRPQRDGPSVAGDRQGLRAADEMGPGALCRLPDHET